MHKYLLETIEKEYKHGLSIEYIADKYFYDKFRCSSILGYPTPKKCTGRGDFCRVCNIRAVKRYLEKKGLR